MKTLVLAIMAALLLTGCVTVAYDDSELLARLEVVEQQSNETHTELTALRATTYISFPGFCAYIADTDLILTGCDPDVLAHREVKLEDLRGRIDALEEATEIWTSPLLLQWIQDDPRLRDLSAVVQRLQWAHPEIEEWGPLQ